MRIRPKRALFISTQKGNRRQLPEVERCVNALSGLFSFLQSFQIHKEEGICYVSTPLAGSSHFYDLIDCHKSMPIKECQRPKRALFISTFLFFVLQLNEQLCQRPKRALFISTVPSGNPHKHWLCRLIFASIYLTILKIKHFHSFFGMLTFL